ncbi:MAG: cysteine peptidase family C39 domain-containing protein [Cyclobacteriaceae bacterium]
MSQNNVEDNAFIALRDFISLLGVSVTLASLSKTKNHPDYPSMLSLSESLHDMRVENLAVNLSLTQLNEIPFPAIAHLRKNNGHFVVLKKIVKDQIFYIDSVEGLILESLEDFKSKWTGAVLLAEKSENSGEKNYTQKRRLEIAGKAKTICLLSLCALFLITPIMVVFNSSFFFTWLILLIIKSVGLALCIVLLFKQLGLNNTFVNKVCNAAKGFDCNSILNSPASKLMGVMSMSELGMLYFAGGALSLLLMSIAKASAFGSLLIFNIITLPYTAFSIYYQWRIVKAWCPFCLAVMMLFWLEFFILFQVADFNSVITEAPIIFMGFTIPVVIWLFFRDPFIKAQRVEGLERSLLKFKRSNKIFKALIERQPLVEIEEFPREIVLGNESAPTSITIVSNPLCGPCSFAHQELEDLLQRYPDHLNVKIRFLVNPDKNGSVDNTVAKEIIKNALSGNKGSVREALNFWFEDREKDVTKWLARVGSNKITQEETTLNEVIKKHHEWCSSLGINATPTFFINNKKLPEEYNVTDFKYHIRHLISEKIEISNW